MNTMGPVSGSLADTAGLPKGSRVPAPGNADVSVSEVTRLARRAKALMSVGETEEAHEAFAELVALEQRRASRLAYWYLRSAADADDAVQDAFVRAFMHLDSYREDLPFEVWFTRICLLYTSPSPRDGLLSRMPSSA